MTENVRERGVTAALESEPDFETLYGQYHQFVRGALRKHYVDPSELEDMTQEVFLVLLRRVDEAAEKRSMGSWLYQVSRRVAANYRRGQRRRVRKHGDLKAVGDRPEASRAPADPEEQLAREEAWAFVRDFLESLDEEACAVFVMSEVEGLRGAEIAARLGLTLPMTYARIRNVRARFGRQVARERRGMLAILFGAIKKPAVALAVIAMAMSWRLKAGLAVVALAIIVLLVARGAGDGPEGPGPSPHAGERSDGDQEQALGTDSDGIRQGPDARGVFAGIVVDVEGAPVVGAVVCGDRTVDNDHKLTDPPVCTTTDARGRFWITGVRSTVHTLEAMAPGHLPGHFHGPPTDDVRIVLHEGGVPLSGVVLDVFGGPVEGAWVAVENRPEYSLGATARTDSSGKFSLWVVEGPISLGAGAPGYATSYTMVLAPSENVRIELGAESMIAGIVVDSSSGAPLEGIRVSALLHQTPDKYANRQGDTYSNELGRWEIRGLQPNHYVMDAAGANSWGRAQQTVDLGIGDRQDGIRIEMIDGVDVVGRIIDAETGEPCAEGFAVTHDKAQNIDRGGLVQDGGWATVECLTGGLSYPVTVSCRGYQARVFDVDLRDGPSPALEWPVTRGAELVARVVDEAGEPLPHWNVELMVPPKKNLRVDASRFETTDAKGSASFFGLSPGTHRISARGSGHPPVETRDVEVGPERSEVILTAVTGVPVTGTVASAEGTGVAGALVILQGPEPGSQLPQHAPYHAITDAAGAYRHSSVRSGEYGVWVVPRDSTVSHLRPRVSVRQLRPTLGDPLRTVVVSNSEVTLDLQLGELQSISGTVRDEDGDLVGDARVFAVREQGGRVRDPRGTPRLTDGNGRYRFDDLLPGTYALTAYRPAGGVVRRTGVEAGTGEANLVFPRTGEVTGSVRSVDGSPVTAYALFIDGGARPRRPFVPVGSAEGRFVVDGLAAGRYLLRAIAPEGLGDAIVDLGPGERRLGIEITLEPRTHVKGRLVDRDGKPLAGWEIAAVDRGAGPGIPWIQARVVAPNGSFRLTDVLVKELAIVAVPRQSSDAPPAVEVYERAPELRVVTPKLGETMNLGDLVVTEMPGP